MLPRFSRLAMAAVAATALGACASGSASAATPKDALVMAWNIDSISTFDPAQVGEVVTLEILKNTCDTLVDFDPKDESKLIPRIAKSWDVSDDNRTITLHLRDDVKFSSGNPVTAEDAAWSLQRVVKLGYGNAATLTEYGFTKENVGDLIKATDDHTLQVKLANPYPVNLVMQAVLANYSSAPLDEKTLLTHQKDGDMGNAWLNTHTECSGPYKLVRWNPGESIVLQAQPGSASGMPKLKRILIRHVAETGTQRLLVAKGDVDIARDLTPEDLKELDAGKDVHVASVLKPQLIFWTFNLQDKIFSHEKVRLAMKYLIDYQNLGDTVMQYLGKPWQSFVQSGAFGALPEKEANPFSLNLKKAKELITEAGYPNGFEATVYVGSLPWSVPLGQSIQANAAKIGVKLNIERMANAQFFAKVRGRQFQTGIKAFQTSVPDANGMASRLVYNPDNSEAAKQTQYPSWRAAYFDPDMNKRVQAAAVEHDPEKRKELYASLQKDWMQKGEMAVMFQTYNVAAVRNTLKNWTWNGFRVYYDEASK